MNKQPMFRENGDGYDVSMTGVLIIAADAVYGDPTETTPEGKRKARALLDGMLAAARAGGYKQGDVLETLLARNQPTRRVLEMAQEACDAAGAGALLDALNRAGL